MNEHHIQLDVAAAYLGTERRRLYDIVNVLASVGYITLTKRHIYQWQGMHSVIKTLAQIQVEFTQEKSASQKYLENTGQPYSMRGLTRCFVQLFLNLKQQMISLKYASSMLTACFQQTPTVNKSQHRRLYDIANILVAVNLIRKGTYMGLKLGFVWNGPDFLVISKEVKNLFQSKSCQSQSLCSTDKTCSGSCEHISRTSFRISPNMQLSVEEAEIEQILQMVPSVLSEPYRSVSAPPASVAFATTEKGLPARKKVVGTDRSLQRFDLKASSRISRESDIVEVLIKQFAPAALNNSNTRFQIAQMPENHVEKSCTFQKICDFSDISCQPAPSVTVLNSFECIQNQSINESLVDCAEENTHRKRKCGAWSSASCNEELVSNGNRDYDVRASIFSPPSPNTMHKEQAKRFRSYMKNYQHAYQNWISTGQWSFPKNDCQFPEFTMNGIQQQNNKDNFKHRPALKELSSNFMQTSRNSRIDGFNTCGPITSTGVMQEASTLMHTRNHDTENCHPSAIQAWNGSSSATLSTPRLKKSSTFYL